VAQWTKWHWDRFFSEYFGFPLSISFHRCSITRKKDKKVIIIIVIFVTGLHKKPQGCRASIASAAGPFTTKKNGPPQKARRFLLLPQDGERSIPQKIRLRPF
jgi:hypothetical protein